MTSEKYEKKVTVKEIVDFFNFEQLTGDEHALERWTIVPDVNRPGFELCGFTKQTDPRRIVVIGSKESEYIRDVMTEDEQRGRFPVITDPLTPAMIITKNNELPPILKEIANGSNFPILRTGLETFRLMTDLITFLDEKLALEDTLSAVLMSAHGTGVLLVGESGMGKSETALEMLRDGNILVADDRVDVEHIHNKIYGHSPSIIKGLLEIRGIGVIDVEKMFGAASVIDRCQIDIVVKLVPFEVGAEYNRIGDEMQRYTKILGVLIPTITIPVSAGRNVAALVESAVINYKMQMKGFNSAEELKKRFIEFSGKEE